MKVAQRVLSAIFGAVVAWGVFKLVLSLSSSRIIRWLMRRNKALAAAIEAVDAVGAMDVVPNMQQLQLSAIEQEMQLIIKLKGVVGEFPELPADVTTPGIPMDQAIADLQALTEAHARPPLDLGLPP